ncbi:gliding motility protein [Archangium violaceum]|uniref:site-specific recombinase n=1 Tax=Archangium violaceum TaxID=83451 RepID=UPI00193BF415|nr:gliding motility protein [Archangium violaceum]QRK08807.1 gliding motility protein [Archangium violaceum]
MFTHPVRSTRSEPGTHHVPTLEQLLARYPSTPETEERLRELHALVTSAPPRAPLAERMDWLEELVRWLRAPGATPSRRGRLAPVESTGSARLRLLAEVLGETPAWCEALRTVVASVLAETSALGLLAEPGLSAGRGLLGEALARLGRRMVPPAPDERALAPLVWRLFPGEEGRAWLDELSVEPVAALCAELGASTFAPLRAAVEDAVSVLALRATNLGLASDVLARLPPMPLEQTAFIRLPRACEALRDAVREGADRLGVERQREACAETLAGCRAAAQVVLNHLRAHAVDTDLVYRLELLGHTLDRLEALLWLLAPERAGATPGAATRLLSTLVRAYEEERSLAGLLRGSVRCISRRIFEHTGEVGRHYITTSEDEYHRLVSAAAGGGLLTAGTAALKLAITFAALPLFFEGLAAATNYALSFTLIQLLGFTLATKQPSMTGAALAASLDVKARDKEMSGLVERLACITRSQLASVFGNLGAVVATVSLVGLGIQVFQGRHLLEQREAEYVVRSLHPFKSGTLFFAALTGVLLWCSSIFGGWLENWVHYQRLPEALARHRGLIGLLGETRAGWLGEALARNACGLGANVSLGLLLGMTPAVGRFFGLPLDVRHVTLSAGTLAFAGTALGPEQLMEPDFLWAVMGLVLVGVINLLVSFSLGLSAAVRARGLAPVGFLSVVLVVFAGGLRTLSGFILPPRPLLPAQRPSSPQGVRSAARACAPLRGGHEHG